MLTLRIRQVSEPHTELTVTAETELDLWPAAAQALGYQSVEKRTDWGDRWDVRFQSPIPHSNHTGRSVSGKYHAWIIK